MNKKIWLLQIGFVVCFITNAQTFHLGIKGGLNIPSSNIANYKNPENTYHVGAFATIGISKKWDFQPEVFFTSSNIEQNNVFDAITKKSPLYKVNYLSIPIAFRIKIAPFIHLSFGPQFSLVLDSKKNDSENLTDAFKANDFSLFGGVEFDFLKFKIYGRYISGLTQLNNITDTDKYTTKEIQAGIGFKFL